MLYVFGHFWALRRGALVLPHDDSGRTMTQRLLGAMLPVPQTPKLHLIPSDCLRLNFLRRTHLTSYP